MSKYRRDDRKPQQNESTTWETKNLGHGTLEHTRGVYAFKPHSGDSPVHERGDYMMVTTDGIGIGIIVVRDGLKVLPNPRAGSYTVNGTTLRLSHGVSAAQFKLTYTDRTLTKFCITTNDGGQKCFSVAECTPVLIQHIDNTIYIWVPESC